MSRYNYQYRPNYSSRSNYRSRPEYSNPSSSTTLKSKCDNSFLKSDKTIDLGAIKKNKMKLDNKNIVYDNFIKYKKTNKKYSETTGILIKKNCSNLSSNSSNSTKKYCSDLKLDKEKYLKDYMSSLSKGVKSKIIKKISKTLKKPKDKRIKRFSCYVKLLLDISNSIECRGNSISLSNIISKFDSEYKPKGDLQSSQKTEGKNYLEYLISNKTISSKQLNHYKKLFSKEEDIKLFKEALEKVINSYSDCK